MYDRKLFHPDASFMRRRTGVCERHHMQDELYGSHGGLRGTGTCDLRVPDDVHLTAPGCVRGFASGLPDPYPEWAWAACEQRVEGRVWGGCVVLTPCSGSDIFPVNSLAYEILQHFPLT